MKDTIYYMSGGGAGRPATVWGIFGPVITVPGSRINNGTKIKSK